MRAIFLLSLLLLLGLVLFTSLSASAHRERLLRGNGNGPHQHHHHHHHHEHGQKHARHLGKNEFREAMERVLTEGAEAGGAIRAGAARVDVTLPVGVPLAGYNHGPRRVPNWPLPEVRAYTTFMMPSTGVLEPTYARALYIDNGIEQVCFLTVDAIGSDGYLVASALKFAAQQGFPLPPEKVIVGGSHSHSGPGAVSKEKLWELAPATDLLNEAIHNQMASSMAGAMMEAWNNLQPARLGLGHGLLLGVTRNRRAGTVPWLKPDTIDPHLGIVRVDRMDGTPMATLWNFATHGTCYGPENMSVSGDIMGVASIQIEKRLGGVALFVNSDAGDIDPTGEACNGAPNFVGSAKIADAVISTRANVTTVTSIDFKVASQVFDFGLTNMNLTLERLGDDCGGKKGLNICELCKVLKCDANLHLGGDWVENTPRFSAVRWNWNNKKWLMVTLPGEPLYDLGCEIRNDTSHMGYDYTFVMGYANNHMGYFCPPADYEANGYEAQLTFWGIETAEMVRKYADQVAALVLN